MRWGQHSRNVEGKQNMLPLVILNLRRATRRACRLKWSVGFQPLGACGLEQSLKSLRQLSFTTCPSHCQSHLTTAKSRQIVGALYLRLSALRKNSRIVAPETRQGMVHPSHAGCKTQPDGLGYRRELASDGLDWARHSRLGLTTLLSRSPQQCHCEYFCIPRPRHGIDALYFPALLGKLIDSMVEIGHWREQFLIRIIRLGL